MKFWQLVSGFRSESAILDSVFSNHDWGEFNEWYAQFDSIVAKQDRTILDTAVPDALAHAVASLSSQTFCLVPDGTLRIARDDSDGETMSALDVLKRFGGAAIEDVHEYGSVHLGG